LIFDSATQDAAIFYSTFFSLNAYETSLDLLAGGGGLLLLLLLLLLSSRPLFLTLKT
jgi:hypothetical protein